MPPAKKKKKIPVKTPKAKIHPWRFCPAGEHLVRTHPMHIPPTEKYPDGAVTTRHEHCALNPSGKDQLYPVEIGAIAEKHFANLPNKPCPIVMKFENGSKYDDSIAGWVQYWNDVLQPKIPLDSNMVKALIASESGFDPKMLNRKKDPNSARGLTQITNATRKILGDENGELQDHFVTVTRAQLNDGNVNTCAGVRWLFQKQKLASSYLGREATWEEAIENYKNLMRKPASNPERIKEIKIYNDFLARLKKCKS